MAELKLNAGIFYILEAGKNDKTIFDTEKNAVGALKRVISANKELDAESVTIMEVNTSEEKWSIKQVPWAKIAMELMRA